MTKLTPETTDSMMRDRGSTRKATTALNPPEAIHRELQVFQEDGDREREAQTHHGRADGAYQVLGKPFPHKAVDHKAD